MPSVPFEIDSADYGVARSQGVMRVEDEDLVFEIQTIYLGFYRRPLHTYRLDLTDLDEVRYERNFWRDRLTIRTRPLDRITDLPGTNGGELCLRIRRKNRRVLGPVLDHLRLWRTNET